jgi:hypothetical protein
LGGTGESREEKTKKESEQCAKTMKDRIHLQKSQRRYS